MSKEEILEGNKLIAEFMGWQFLLDRENWYKVFHNGDLRWSDTPKYVNEILLSNTGYGYHFSWDKIMPVVEKIEGLSQCDFSYKYYIGSRYCNIVVRTLFKLEFNSDTYEDTTLNAVFTSVVPFIKWYNNNRTEHESHLPKLQPHI